MNWFTAFCGLVFLGVILYIDVISLILGRDFRAGVSIVPIMLLSYMMLGMQFNVSMWYKLSGKTSAAVWITLAGLAVTAVINVIFMPRYSYHAAAWGHLASYVVMLAVNVFLGKKYYPVPYNWKLIFCIFAGMGIIWAVSTVSSTCLFPDADFSAGGLQMAGKLAVNTVLVLGYAAFSWLLLRRSR